MARAILVIGVVAALVTSITFAALQSQATLTNNTISSATADLTIANYTPAIPETETPAACGDFAATANGFAFTGVVPGGADSQTETFCLSNEGSADLSVVATIPALPTYTDGDANPVVVDKLRS